MIIKIYTFKTALRKLWFIYLENVERIRPDWVIWFASCMYSKATDSKTKFADSRVLSITFVQQQTFIKCQLCDRYSLGAENSEVTKLNKESASMQFLPQTKKIHKIISDASKCIMKTVMYHLGPGAEEGLR